MYPDLPDSPADLAPLPHCDGPKLRPFDFHGSQKIEFLEYIGEGLHSHVFQVNILGSIYALKLFRFVYDEDWYGPAYHSDHSDIKRMSAFYNYSEPFSCECRAFGRLQEAGHEELAVRCFGYMLLDEEHEQAMMDQFRHLRLEFNGNIQAPGRADMRSRFLSKSGRLPPIRGIVKEFGHGEKELGARDLRRILRDIVGLQQLGIIGIDVAERQLISGKFCDFSQAITVPHYITTPELNPHLTPEWIYAMEFETFQFSINDYWDFDEMVREWDEEHEHRKAKTLVYAFPGGRFQIKYDLRSTPLRERVYSFVDPRLYDWRTPAASLDKKIEPQLLDARRVGRKAKDTSSCRAPNKSISKTRRRLVAKPPRWYYDCNSAVAAVLKSTNDFSTSLEWDLRNGFIFPARKR